jgi:hypothetical protein
MKLFFWRLGGIFEAGFSLSVLERAAWCQQTSCSQPHILIVLAVSNLRFLDGEINKIRFG